jgi:hypothetical protein
MSGSEGWFDRPMRWAQLTLVEDDPLHYDRQWWLDYFERTHSDAACLSAGGCVAYYPTEIPFHHRSKWMGDTDPLGELIQGCRKRDMVVIVRTDPHSVLDDAAEAHPEWLAVDAQGNKRKHWATPGRWVTCALGPYNFRFMTEVHQEIMSMYNVEGIFSNRWAGHGICYCERCQRNFHDAYGMELPRTRDPQDAAYRNYLLWRQERLFALWHLWDGAIREINPEARYIPNTGGGALSSLDMKTVGELSDILFADRQARRGVMAPWAAGKNGKEYRATLGQKPVGGIFSVGVEERYRWKDSVTSDAEIRIWVADGIANGMRPWYTKFCGTLHDDRWVDVVEDIYDRHYRWEAYLRNEVSLARIGMVYSQQTAAYYGGTQAREKVEDHTLGFYHALIEGRIPFEMVHDRLLDEQHLAPFKTLILPNIAALSGQQCQQLRAFVEHGGSLVATFETSLYDEWGQRRNDLALADLFGVQCLDAVEGPMQNSYLRIEADPATGEYHPLLSGLENAQRIINGVYRLPVKDTLSRAYAPLTLVPSYPDLPMEEVYPRQPKTSVPEILLRELGESRIVYFPWDVDRAFWEVMCVDHGKLLQNAVQWSTNEEPVAEVTGPGVLDVTVWRQAASMAVHLVNLTNPMMMKGPFRELIPVGQQLVRVRLPEGRQPQRVRLLAADQTVPTDVSDGCLRVTVPSVLDHEVIAIDL